MNRDTFIFIPAYNVSKELPALLESIPAAALLRCVEIVIIDDGSKDASFEIASAFASREIRARIRVERSARNGGYGAVVKRGLSLFRESGAEFAVCLHGDGQYPAAQIPEFLEYMSRENVDVLQGSRHLTPGGARRGNMPFYKIIGGKFLTAVENLCFKYKLTDRHSGFLCYSKKFAEAADVHKLSGSFDIDLELLALAEELGLRIAELPIPARYAGERSNLKVIPYGIRVLRVALRHKLRMK